MTIRTTGFLFTITASAILIAGSAQAACRDPWVTNALTQVGQSPSSGESGNCNINLYNNGRWGSYNELLGYVKSRYPALSNARPAPALAPRANPAQMINPNGGRLIGDGGGTLIGHDGATFRNR